MRFDGSLPAGGGFENEAAAAEAARAAAASVGLSADEVDAAVLAALTAFNCFLQDGQTAGTTASIFRVNATATTTAMTTTELTSALSDLVNGRRPASVCSLHVAAP